MTGKARETANERFGMNLRSLRERKGMKQAELAEAMAGRGWSWHQSTVSSVEGGRQSVSFDEAIDLAAILRTSLDRFTWSGPEASATEFVYMAGSRLRQNYEVVADGVCRLLADQAGAERTITAHKDSKWERVREAVEDVAVRIEQYGPDEAIEEGVRRYQERTRQNEEEKP